MRIGLAQMQIGDSLTGNAEKVVSFIREASSDKVDFIAFPETCLTGYLGISLNCLSSVKMKSLYKALNEIQDLCRELCISVATGQYFRRCGRWYNNAVVFGSDGKCKTSYDKNHLIDRDCFDVVAGREPPEVFQLQKARVSIGICHDIRYPEPWRWAAIKGSQIQACLFYGVRSESDLRDQEIYDAHLSTRAAENGVFLVATNVAAKEQMVRSQIRDPEGRLLVRANSWKEELLVSDIEPDLGGQGWVERRRGDLYTLKLQPKERGSVFDEGFWERPYYIIEHDRRLMGDQET